MKLKIKSPLKLIISILIAQSAGIIGSFFTFSAIPTWYIFLNKPTFSPPNWLFGPVWTILYTMIGISFYKIWIGKVKRDKYWPTAILFFTVHLVLNSIWSIIFFGIKNLGLAFWEIIILWLTIVTMIIKFKKIDKLAAYLLIPYLLWVSFASLLNFSVWQLNKNISNSDVFAQEFNSGKAFEDFLFVQDEYRQSLENFELKRNSYIKNQTLSLKEETRLNLYTFLNKRNEYKKSYLTLIRMRVVESNGLLLDEKESIFSKIDPQIAWLTNRKNVIKAEDSLEDLLNKSTEEDAKYKTETTPIIYYSISSVGLSSIKEIKEQQLKIYQNLKGESENLVKLGRADISLFNRWYQDIDNEIKNIEKAESELKLLFEKILSDDNYSIASTYNKSVDGLTNAKAGLLKLNDYINELEQVVAEKR